MKENKYLKWLLIVQSFLPLFFLVIIRCYNKIRGKMILDFIITLSWKSWGYWECTKTSRNLCHKLVVLLCDNVCVRSFGIFFLQKKSELRLSRGREKDHH